MNDGADEPPSGDEGRETVDRIAKALGKWGPSYVQRRAAVAGDFDKVSDIDRTMAERIAAELREDA